MSAAPGAPPSQSPPPEASGGEGVRVRRATRADADAARRLWLLLQAEHARLDPRFAPAGDAALRWTTEFADLLASANDGVWVAEAEGAGGSNVVGLATAHLRLPAPIYEQAVVAYVDVVVVAPEARGRGIGRRLVAHVEAWAREEGARDLEAGVVAANAGARAFWRSVGAHDAAVTVRKELTG